MTDKERQGQIIWFQDLREAIVSSDKKSALEAIDAYIKLLRKPLATEGDCRPLSRSSGEVGGGQSGNPPLKEIDEVGV